MKIAFLLTQSLESPGGAGRFGPLAREMARLGHEVEIYALHPDWESLQEKPFFDRGVQVDYVSQMHLRKAGARKIYYSPAQLVWVSWRAALRMARALRRSSADIIQVCKPQPINTLAARLAGGGRPLFFDCDDYEAEINRFSSPWQRRIVEFFEDSIVHFAAGITTNTRFTQERYINLGFPPELIRYVPNAVERERFESCKVIPKLREKLGLAPDAPVILYIGAMAIRTHAVDLLLEAFRLVADRLPEARLLLVGGGEDYDRLVELSRQLEIQGKTIFTGQQPSQDIPAYLAIATLSVDPVRDDLVARSRCPLKIVESLAMGVPVVTGDVGDRRSLLHDGQLGLMANPGDPESLAQKILLLLQKPELRRQISVAALEARQSFTWDHWVGHFLNLYTP